MFGIQGLCQSVQTAHETDVCLADGELGVTPNAVALCILASLTAWAGAKGA